MNSEKNSLQLKEKGSFSSHPLNPRSMNSIRLRRHAKWLHITPETLIRTAIPILVGFVCQALCHWNKERSYCPAPGWAMGKSGSHRWWWLQIRIFKSIQISADYFDLSSQSIFPCQISSAEARSKYALGNK